MPDPIDLPYRQLLQTIGLGVAVADPESWAVLFENACFFHWFEPPEDDLDAPLDRRVPQLSAAKSHMRLGKGPPFTVEIEVRKGPLRVRVAVELRRESLDGRDYLVIEARDMSKQREAEYMLDSYARLVERSTRELAKEKERVEKLLLNVMPRAVYEELKDLGATTPRQFESVTILLLDFIGFTDRTAVREPSVTIAELSDIFSAFDRIVELFGCERLKTIGDAYMAVSGLSETIPDHAANIARVALRMRRYLEQRNAAQASRLDYRVGISTGPVIGSIIGIQKYVYDVFGPTVSLAARLQHLSEPMQITVCERTYALLREDFVLSERGVCEVKGFGPRRLYHLNGEALRAR